MDRDQTRRQSVRNGKIKVPGPDERTLVHHGGDKPESQVVAS